LLVVLPSIFGVDGVWAALPISDAVAFVTAWIVMIRYMRKFKSQR
jgi:Na+-driven multidrug efflux pump